MEKNYKNSLSPEQEKYIKEKLFEKYGETFKEYGINSIDKSEICNLAEFLIAEHPEKYAKSMGTENNYRRDENLQKIYAVIDKEKNIAVMINTNDKGKISEGEFGVYDLKNHKFEVSKQIKENIKKSIRKFSNGTLTEKEIDEMTDEISPKNLDDMDKIATIGERNIDEKVRKSIDKKIDEKNEENGKSKEERQMLETRNKNESQVVIGKEDNGRVSKQSIPADVQKACKRIGVNKVRSFFYVNATELSNRVDGTKVNKNGDRVLILEVYDNKLECNKYYGMQNNKMILYGNDSEANNAVKDVTGNVTQMGKIIKPLKPKEAQFIEYEDSQGLVIREEIDDNSELSMQEINNYREQMEEILTQYSQQVYAIKNDSLLSGEQKIERIQAIDDWCDQKTTDIALENDISMNDDRNIDAVTDEHTEEVQEEIEAWEVPGRRKRGE